jgi:hypothetical protein
MNHPFHCWCFHIGFVNFVLTCHQKCMIGQSEVPWGVIQIFLSMERLLFPLFVKLPRSAGRDLNGDRLSSGFQKQSSGVGHSK